MALRVTRQVVECFGRAGAISKMTSVPTNSAQFLLANWVNDIHFDTYWLTKISRSKTTLAEERRSLQDKPLRTQKVSYLARSWGENTRLVSALLRHAQNQSAIPIYCDISVITQNSSSKTIYCDTRWRRFFIGQQVAIVDPTLNVQYGRIVTLRDKNMILESTVTASEGDLVFPLMICDITLQFQPSLITSRVTQANATFDEVNDSRTLPATWEGSLEGFFEYYNGFPVFETAPNWSDQVLLQIRREGQKYGQGKGRIVSVDGDRPVFGFTLPLCFDNREDFWAHLNFFDSRRGRTRPFFIRAPHELWAVEGADIDRVLVSKTAPLADFQDFYDYISLGLGDGSKVLRGIQSITDNGSNFQIKFDVSLSPSEAGDIESATPAHLVRFNKDELSERWETNDTVLLNFEVVEVLNEGSFEISVA